jgi:cytidyltransferase-like protein
MELAAAAVANVADLELLLEKGQSLRADLRVTNLLVTLGELGIALLDSSGIHRFPALAHEGFDVSGAGDTVIATVAAAVSAGLQLHDAIPLANIAAGIVIRKVGTVAIDRNELRASLTADSETFQLGKICSLDGLRQRVALWRVEGQRIVFTNGCFDLLHPGHLALLEQAKREGDRLIVALNTDRTVCSLKGPGRPIISEEARARLLAAATLRGRGGAVRRGNPAEPHPGCSPPRACQRRKLCGGRNRGSPRSAELGRASEVDSPPRRLQHLGASEPGRNRASRARRELIQAGRRPPASLIPLRKRPGRL